METNEKTYKINLDARVLELLGPHLYTNIYYVLAELIANAYDADAENVYIEYTEDSIRVEDDGHGMSYNRGDINNYLNVARISRKNEEESKTRAKNRAKMGRKGIGKLASLSVSEKVEVMTISSDGEKSGFILTRTPVDNKLQPIKEEEINLKHVTKTNGTAIVMRNPEYDISKSLNTIKRNIIKIFPMVNEDFKIHIIGERGKKEIIDRYDENIIKELSTFISLGESFKDLSNLVPNDFDNNDSSIRTTLVENREAYTKNIKIRNNDGDEKDYELQITGWIGAYKSTKGRKASNTDFPDNFISLYANKKMGQFNILPDVGKNKLNEVYVVGQLHVDLFEDSSLPDMALSNRQGYKSDDIRYQVVKDYIQETLLPDILKKRVTYSCKKNEQRKIKKLEKEKKNEEKLIKGIDKFKSDVSSSITQDIKINHLSSQDKKELKEIIDREISRNMVSIGIKKLIEDTQQKKRILISHSSKDKSVADLIYDFLIFNNIPAEDILYTSCDSEISRIPENTYSIYEYLRDFFVESYSDQKIYVIFVTSEHTPKAWGAMTEIGAAWITQIDNKIFNVHPFRPEHPLNDNSLWHTTYINEKKEISMDRINADSFCVKIENICDKLGYKKKTREENFNRLKNTINIS